jgi:hypothetical protein
MQEIMIMKKKKLWLIIVILLVLLLAGAACWMLRPQSSTKDTKTTTAKEEIVLADVCQADVIDNFNQAVSSKDSMKYLAVQDAVLSKANYSNDSDCMYILSFTALQLRDSRAEQYINRLEKLNIISASYDSAFQYAFKTTDELRQELKAINDAGSSYQKDQIDSEMGGDGA